MTLDEDFRQDMWYDIPDAVRHFCNVEKKGDASYLLTLTQSEHGDQKEYTVSSDMLNDGIRHMLTFGDIDTISVAEKICGYFSYDDLELSIVFQFGLWGEAFYF